MHLMPHGSAMSTPHRVTNARELSPRELIEAVKRGRRFVRYRWVLSFGLFTLGRWSAVHLVVPGDEAQDLAMPYSLITVLFGWWSPWGVRASLRALELNQRGGADVTYELLVQLYGELEYTSTPQRPAMAG